MPEQENSMTQAHDIIANKLQRLSALVRQYPDYIPIDQAAGFLNTDAESLRTAIDQGKCPFGYSWRRDDRGYRAFKIPSTTFYLWYTAGHIQ